MIARYSHNLPSTLHGSEGASVFGTLCWPATTFQFSTFARYYFWQQICPGAPAVGRL